MGATATGVFFRGGGQAFRAAIAHASDSADLVVLVAVIPGGVSVVPGVADSAAPGEPVAIVGFPSGLDAIGDDRKAGAEATAAIGSVTGLDPDHFEVDAYGALGSSGSPTFNPAGQVVGMVFGARGTGGQRRFYALPGRMLKTLIESLGPAR